MPFPQCLDVLSAGIANSAIKIEYLFSNRTSGMLQTVYQNAMSSSYGSDINPNALLLLWQLAKGMKFAHMIACGTSALHNLDERGNHLVQELALYENRIYQDLSGNAPLNNEELTTAYEDTFEEGHDASSLGLNDIRRHFEAKLYRYLSDTIYTGGNNGWFKPPLYVVADIQSALDVRTVLLNFFEGKATDGRLAVFCCLVTKESVQVAQITHDYPASWFFGPKRSTLAVLNQMVREGVAQMPPHGTEVDPKTGALLNSLRSGFLGPFEKLLKDCQAAGKDHLCIVPHAGCHYFPFHLLGSERGPLATTWIVTYLPNLALLGIQQRRPRSIYPQIDALAAFGIEYKGDPDWAALPGVTASAAQLAEMFRSEAFFDAAVTNEKIVNICTQFRFVHIYSHGKHVTRAPSFQFVPLTHGEAGKARLVPMDILKRDMRNVEVLTLGACESALGRFDHADNLRGLPAAFFMAGVCIVIGTLWEVALSVCIEFYKVFYSAVSADIRPLDAFAASQKAVRESHPAYRDWGAFVFMGDWLDSTGCTTWTTAQGIPYLKFHDGDSSTVNKKEKIK
jgi:CHAT domain-containing protein